MSGVEKIHEVVDKVVEMQQQDFDVKQGYHGFRNLRSTTESGDPKPPGLRV
jgi:hypothetical protein